MRVAIVGYGKMGHEVEAVLRERGHEPVVAARGGFPPGCAVGIDFTSGPAVPDNVARALSGGARYVVGTTGWGDRFADVRRSVESARGGLVHGANFSLGVNLYYHIVRAAAALMGPFPDYDPYVLERHHRHKKDAPSGTARVLSEILESSMGPGRTAASTLTGGLPEGAFHVASLRAGGIVGDHTVGFDSGGDEILIEHRARSRRGFAQGAVLAAEWIAGRSGFHAFDSVLEHLMKTP